MQIQSYQIGNRGMLKNEGRKIRIKGYKISNDIKGKILTVEIPLTEQSIFLEEKAELSEQKGTEKNNHEKISVPDAEINIIQKDGKRSARLFGAPPVIIDALGGGLADAISEITTPDIPLTALEEIANQVRDGLLKIMRRRKGYL